MRQPAQRRAVLAFFALTLSSSFALAQSAVGGPALFSERFEFENQSTAEPELREFRLVSYFLTRITSTNQVASPVGLQGVSLGPIGIDGGSFTRVQDDVATFAEQRWIPYMIYKPNFFDGRIELHAQFEVDFAWGFGANTAVQNQGGGISADQVNLQTKNVNAAFYPTGNPRQLAIVVGLQSFYDSPKNPTNTLLDEIVQSGYKLAYMGSDVAGISVYGDSELHRWRAAFLPIMAAQANLSEQDPRFSYAIFGTLDYAYKLTPVTALGFSYWFLNDSTDGTGNIFGTTVNNGPSNSAESLPFTGVGPFPVDAAEATIHFFGTNFQHNVGFANGDFSLTGFAMLNIGSVSGDPVTANGPDDVSVFGLGANLEAQYRYGKTAGDIFTFETMYTTGDDDLTDDSYGGVFTMNYYGLPGAIWFNHKMLLLFPFTTTVSNYTGAVTDISNRGLGLLAGLGTAQYDLIDDRLNLKIGAGYARSMARPAREDGASSPGFSHGVEINAELTYTWRYFMTVGAHVGYLAAGSFYDGNDRVTSDPWAGFLTLTWVGF
ncbi:MAG: hypothetical protein AAF654_05540 [Myxococcota bacterium]